MSPRTLTDADYDPSVLDQIRARHPRAWPNHLTTIRLARREECARLEALDAELEMLTARRRLMVDRLAVYRRRLFPRLDERHGRRHVPVDGAALPPRPCDAEDLDGVALRRTAMAVLRRHGPLPLRDLHGLLRRYGYDVAGPRAVQRLADAMAYECEQGRARRVARGVYAPAPVGDRAARATSAALPTVEPRFWVRPDDEPVVDTAIADDPDRWSAGSWPASASTGHEVVPGAVDGAVAAEMTDLSEHSRRTRARLAALPRRRTPPDHPNPHRMYDPITPEDEELLPDDEDPGDLRPAWEPPSPAVGVDSTSIRPQGPGTGTPEPSTPPGGAGGDWLDRSASERPELRDDVGKR